MNSNAAVFGICSPESGYGSPAQGYPVTTEHLSAFYGSGGSSAPGSGGSSSGGGGNSSGEPSSPSPYSSAGGGGHSDRHHAPEPKYEPSHSPNSGIISENNGLQYANLDGSELKAAGYAGYPGSGHSHQAYQAHHSLVQSAYAHHYG